MEEIAYCVVDAVFIDRSGDIVGRGLDLVVGITHSYTYGRITEHFDIVAAITKGHYLIARDGEMIADLLNAHHLTCPLGNNIGEERAPSGAVAARKLRHYILLLIFGEERYHLEDIVRFVLAEVILRDAGKVELAEDIFDDIIVVVYNQLVLENESARKLMTRSHKVVEFADIVLCDTMTIDDLAVNNSHGPVDGNKSVETEIAEIIDREDMTSASNEETYARLTESRETVDGRLRHTMGIETDESAVDIEKDGFDAAIHIIKFCGTKIITRKKKKRKFLVSQQYFVYL